MNDLGQFTQAVDVGSIQNARSCMRRIVRTGISLENVNGEPAILINRNQVRPGHASFFTMHCELDESLRISRFNSYSRQVNWRV